MTTNVQRITRIIADIGGTNIRLAIVDEQADGYYRNISTYKCADYAGLAEVLKLYISEQQLENCRLSACLAIACPVDDDLISMTNLPWQFSQSALKETLKLESLTLINDYTAIAMAIPLLSDTQKVKIGDGEAVAGKPISVCGPGTGLGVANLIPVGDKWHCVSGEGGHVDYAPVGELEIEILRFLNKIKQRVARLHDAASSLTKRLFARHTHLQWRINDWLNRLTLIQGMQGINGLIAHVVRSLTYVAMR